jgi:hypothetical protein
VSLAIFDAEEGTAGTTLSTANTAFDSVTIGSGATGTFSSTSPLFGSLSYQFVHPNSSVSFERPSRFLLRDDRKDLRCDRVQCLSASRFGTIPSDRVLDEHS